MIVGSFTPTDVRANCTATQERMETILLALEVAGVPMDHVTRLALSDLVIEIERLDDLRRSKEA